MSKKCIGCGEIMQFTDKDALGYVNEKVYEKAEICERCFKLKYYGKDALVNKKVNSSEFIDKLNKEKKSVLFLVDSLCISNEVFDTIKRLNTNVYVVLTKRDLLPKSVKDYKLIKYIKENTGVEKVLVISSKKKHGIDEVYNRLVKDNLKEIYVCGYTNAGKSTLINSLLKSKEKEAVVTVSSNPNTTLEEIKINLEGITFIDTPGFVSENNISNFLDINIYKNLLAKKEIKPKVHTIKKEFMIILGNILRIENNNDETSLVFYFSNDMSLEKMRSIRNDRLKDKDKITIQVNTNEDIVIEGIGFIKVNTNAILDIFALDKRVISKRNKMI